MSEVANAPAEKAAVPAAAAVRETAPLEAAPSGSPPARMLALQRSAGNAALSRSVRPVQRAPKDAEGILDGMTITTYREGAAWCMAKAKEVAAESLAVSGEGGTPPPVLAAVQEELQTKAASQNVDAHMDDVTYKELGDLQSKATGAINAGEGARTYAAAMKLRENRAKIQQTQEQLLVTQAQVDDKKPAALRGGDSSTLTTLWNWSTALYDSALAATPLIEQSTAIEQDLLIIAKAAGDGGPNVGGSIAKFTMPDKGKVLPILNGLDKLVAAYAAVQAFATLASAGTTASEKAKSTVSASVSLASSATTLFGICSDMGLELNLYIGPMTDACLGALGKLEDLARKTNRDMIKAGQYDKVNWDLENGGRPVFDFLLAARNAGSAEELPHPVPSAVSAYFVDNEEAIEAGASKGAGDEMPTTGYWFWKKTDAGKIATWVFNHRQQLWATFYGSVQPNTPD